MKISKIPIATMMTFVSFSFLNAFDTGVYICDTNGLEKLGLKLLFGDADTLGNYIDKPVLTEFLDAISRLGVASH